MKSLNIIKLVLPGVLISFALSFLGFRLSALHPLLDALFVAFIGGIIIGNIIRQKTFLYMGIGLCKDILIPVGLFLYGTQINLKDWAAIKSNVFLFAVLNLIIYLAVILLINRYVFKILNNKISFLNGGANAICGVSATAVFIPFVDAKDNEVTLTLVSIVIAGLVSVFATWFVVQEILNLSMQQYAQLCGLTLNQTGATKVAASFMSKDAVKIAVMIKNFRTSMIIPVGLLLMFLSQAFGGTASKMSPELRKSAVYYGIFIAILFFGGALLFSFTPLSVYVKSIKPTFTVLFGMTLASVGLLCNLRNVSIKDMASNTISAIIAWFVVVMVTVKLIRLI
ncbi:MAG: putative sulfate exporter family transporter [Candidatus Omnitrophota bacterium]|nr:YeiH family protein [Candidatus Omnitrophota bacterium]MBU1928924.1 YeiH family protein [Candidatus Omnitrophota bacterium]MBU2035351.1 YeiH family protein [Candidatus Omnitrophota bacterium]MBU2258749.1 YeiH family protein [Candidatus Omnitrophota bacterium]